MKLKDPLFYAKILLFGEYSIIEDSMGLSIPYNFYQGRLQTGEMNTAEDEESNSHLRKYYEYLKDLSDKGELKCELDLDRFNDDLATAAMCPSGTPT